MKRVPIAEFKAHCSQLIEELGQDEIVITKHGKAVARVVAEPKRKDLWAYYGSVPGLWVDPDDDLLSTGARWDADSSPMGRRHSGQNF
jgi:prevent-host-death family protein